MKETTRNFMVGVTSIVGLVALAALLMSFGEFDALTNPRYKVTLITSNAAGLRVGGGVEYDGVPVGSVDSVYTVSSDVTHPVRVQMAISKDVSIPADVQCEVTTPLIGGSALLRLTSPPRAAGQTVQNLPKDGSATLTAELSGGMLDAVTKALDERMKPLLDSLEKFNTLADTYAQVGQNINNLLAPQSEQALANGEPPNLRTAVLKINAAIDQATEGLRLAKEWLSDEQMRNDARTALSKAHDLIEKATVAVDRYTKLADSIQSHGDDLSKRVATVADELSATLEDVRALARKANSGEGTVGQLLNNPALYNSLNDAAIRLERTLVEVQLFIQKVKAEGLPMKLF